MRSSLEPRIALNKTRSLVFSMKSKQKERLKQKLYGIYSESALRSDYSPERAYFCPLCGKRFNQVDGLSPDEVPFKALGLPYITF